MRCIQRCHHPHLLSLSKTVEVATHRTCLQAHARKHTHARMHARSHTRAHTHTQSRASSCLLHVHSFTRHHPCWSFHPKCVHLCMGSSTSLCIPSSPFPALSLQLSDPGSVQELCVLHWRLTPSKSLPPCLRKPPPTPLMQSICCKLCNFCASAQPQARARLHAWHEHTLAQTTPIQSCIVAGSACCA